MALPKYITHPIGLLLGFGALFAILRQSSVNIHDMKNLFKITSYDNGVVELEGQKQRYKLADPRFTVSDDVHQTQLSKYFTGKYLKLASLPADGQIRLPVLLYDGACFMPKTAQTQSPVCQPIQIRP